MNTSNTTSFLDLFLGMPGAEFGFSLFLILLGSILYISYKIKNRKNKTVKPSLKVWFNHKDNLLALPIAIILMYISIRFHHSYQGWLMQKINDIFGSNIVLVPYLIMFISGFYQHYLSVQLNKLAKKI